MRSVTERINLWSPASGTAFAAPFSATGLSTVAFVGQAIKKGAMSATGLAVVSFVGAEVDSAPFTAVGVATASFVGASTATAAMSATGLATVAFTGTISGGGAMSATGVATASFVGASEADAALSATGLATVSFVGAIAALVSDHFTDSNGTALQSHTPDTGSAAIIVAGAYDIQSNRANDTEDGASGTLSCAIYDSGVGDFTLTFTGNSGNTKTNGLIGPYFRSSDTSGSGTLNGWGALFYNDGATTACDLYKFIAGVVTGPVNTTTFSLTANTDYTFQIVCSGSSITVKVNGTTRLTATDSFGATNTKHGFLSTSGGSAGARGYRFDDLTITSP